MVLDNTELCTGCGACSAICPQKHIKMDLSIDGFYRPYINPGKRCTKCNQCKDVCVTHNQPVFHSPLSTYIASSKDEITLSTCSSGGISYELSKYLLENGYSICSCKYNPDKNIAEHSIINDIQELDRAKGSKYIPSYTGEAFQKLLDNEKYAVIGTPCQIAGIRNIIKKKGIENKFILIDFFCHGIPSYRLWEKYCQFVLKKVGNEEIKDVMFRDKTYGWGKYVIRIDTNKDSYYSVSDGGLFYKFFLGNLCLNQPCYSCHFRTVNSLADIRIGDCWNAKFAENQKGISAILVFTKTGQKLINEIEKRCNILSESVDVVLGEQIVGDISIPLVKRYIDKLMQSDKGLKSIYNRYIILRKILKIKNTLARTLK